MCSSIHPIISTLLQDLKLTKHWFSSFQWVPLQEGMNEICATFRPPITIFLMAGALTMKSDPELAYLVVGGWGGRFASVGVEYHNHKSSSRWCWV